jgi:hypothetical protein
MNMKGVDSDAVATIIALVRSQGGEVFVPSHIMEDMVDGWELQVEIGLGERTMTLRAVKVDMAEETSLCI